MNAFTKLFFDLLSIILAAASAILIAAILVGAVSFAWYKATEVIGTKNPIHEFITGDTFTPEEFELFSETGRKPEERAIRDGIRKVREPLLKHEEKILGGFMLLPLPIFFMILPKVNRAIRGRYLDH